MSEQKAIHEKREFFRLSFTTPLEFKSYKESNSKEGTAQNVSQSGILFSTQSNPPEISSLVWLDLDLRTLRICQEIEARALVVKNGLLGRVVRVEESPAQPDGFDVGVCFLTKTQGNSREVQTLLANLPK
ncbi:MAG: PilZ domain-containing protein [Candidatus Omnitrophica bacterium]|nr:PilZ domain-containing protein [Candidatus Omnitrophota bacterium]